MRADVRLGSLACVGLLLVGVLVACTPKSPEEKVIAARALYRATLHGFVLQEEVVAAEPVGDDLEAEGQVVVEGEEGDETAGTAEPEVIQNVLVDILVRHDSYDPLPGVTVDISQVDADEMEKGHWLLWVDTDGLAKATAIQVSHVLENISYEEGDGFFAEVRAVPEAERGDYGEFGGS